MKTSTLLAVLFAIVAVTDALKCYQGCGKAKAAGVDTSIPCESKYEVNCTDGQVCATVKTSYELVVEMEDETADCGEKGKADEVCDALKAVAEGITGDFECDVDFCDTDLCNSGSSAFMSFLIMVTGALIFGLF